jgi:hypothetical protein
MGFEGWYIEDFPVYLFTYFFYTSILFLKKSWVISLSLPKQKTQQKQKETQVFLKLRPSIRCFSTCYAARGVGRRRRTGV